jgi:hypothetical protein
MTHAEAHDAYLQLMRTYAEMTSVAFVCQIMEEALQTRGCSFTATPRATELRPCSTALTFPVQTQGKRRAPRFPASAPKRGRRDRDRRRRGRDQGNASRPPQTAFGGPLHTPVHEARLRRPLFADVRQDGPCPMLPVI